MGRLCYLSTIGKYAAKTLLLVPLESMYIAVQEERTKLEKDYYSTLENMMRVHCDFDLGDEQIIEEIGYNEKGVLKIGEMEYNTIVIPELLTLRNSTIQKLLDFARSGGKILILNGYPRYVDAEENTLLLDELKQLSTLLVNDSNTLKENLDVLTVSHTMDAAVSYTHLNYFINRSTNASAESLNSKIKQFRAQLHGVIDVKFFLFRLSKIFG